MQRTVIDEDLIIECIKASIQSELDAKDDEKNNKSSKFHQKQKNKMKHADEESASETAIDFTAICELSLSFRDIYKIDHLRGFESLVQLRLDNNLIECIENLGHLVNLEWLDLSFNKISKIEGLNGLTKLTDLCLVNNRIERIENLQNNKKLQVLSLANNCIQSIDENILCLRQFHHLSALNLRGNPLCSETDFRVSVLAYCANLKFLDYESIKNEEKNQAKNAKKAKLAKIEFAEAENEKIEKKEAAKIAQFELFCAANVEGVHSLFDDMIREDSETMRLQNLPGFDKEIEKLQACIAKQGTKYFDGVSAVYAAKKSEDEALRETLKKVAFDSERISIQQIDAFCGGQLDKLKDESSSVIEAKLRQTSDALMECEMQCVEKINFVMSAYEDRITDLMKQNLSNAEGYFSEVVSLENDHYQSLLDLICFLFEQIKADGIDAVIEALPENEALRNMIADKEALNNSVTLSHDNHISHIGRLEDLVRDREEKEKKEKMQKLNDEQYKRNRLRISEILIFVQKYKKHFGIKIKE